MWKREFTPEKVRASKRPFIPSNCTKSLPKSKQKESQHQNLQNKKKREKALGDPSAQMRVEGAPKAERTNISQINQSQRMAKRKISKLFLPPFCLHFELIIEETDFPKSKKRKTKNKVL